MSAGVSEVRSRPDELAAEAAAFLRARFSVATIDLAFVLGSGWSAADDLGTEIGHCELVEVPGFAKPSVVGHGGTLRLVTTAGEKVAAIFTGRTHLYEGGGVAQVVHGVRAEMAQKLADVIFRRTDLGTAGDPGHEAVSTCAEIMAPELGWDRKRISQELSEVDSQFGRN